MKFISQEPSRTIENAHLASHPHLLSGINWPQIPIAEGLEVDAGVCMFLGTMDSHFSHFQSAENEHDFKRRWDGSAVNELARG